MHDFVNISWTWLIGLIGLTAVAIIYFTSRNKQKDKSAIDTLKERYAKGEISKEEFEEKKNGLL